MENVVGGLSGTMGHYTEYLRDDDPIYPCDIVKTKYQPACYHYQTTHMNRVLDYDMAAVAALCTEAPEESQMRCFDAELDQFCSSLPTDRQPACRPSQPTKLPHSPQMKLFWVGLAFLAILVFMLWKGTYAINRAMAVRFQQTREDLDAADNVKTATQHNQAEHKAKLEEAETTAAAIMNESARTND